MSEVSEPVLAVAVEAKPKRVVVRSGPRRLVPGLRMKRWLALIRMRLMAEGMKAADHAKVLGVSETTVAKWVSDPAYRALEDVAKEEFLTHAAKGVARRAAEELLGPKVAKGVGEVDERGAGALLDLIEPGGVA